MEIAVVGVAAGSRAVTREEKYENLDLWIVRVGGVVAGGRGG
jgi:hypothetical protein